MARINVKFGVTQRTSAAGNDYYLLEMRTTNQDGIFRELPDVKLTPFTARLLLEHLPEFCEAITEAERQKAAGGPAPQVAPATVEEGGVVAPQGFQEAAVGEGVQPGHGSEDTPF